MSESRFLRRASVAMLFVAASVTASSQIDSEPPVDPIARLDCPPVVVGSLSVVNASNPTEVPAELLVQVFDKSGKSVLSRRIRLEPGASESVALRLDHRFRFQGRLVRARIDQIDGALGILATHQGLQRGIGGLTAVPNVVCTTPNRPF